MTRKTAWGARAITVPSTAAPNAATVIRYSSRLVGWSLAASTAETQTQSNPANPGANSFTYTNNSGVNQQLVAAQFLFTADAVVANRNVRLQILDAAANVVFVVLDETATVASTSVQFSGSIGATQQNTAAGTFIASLPQGISLLPNWQVVLGALAADAGDTVTNIHLVFQNAVAGFQASINDGGQPVGFSSAPAGFSDTQNIEDDGIFCGTSVIVTALAGTVQGVIYVRDGAYPESDRPWEATKSTSSP